MPTPNSPTEIIYNVSRQLNTSLDLDEALGKVLKLAVEAIEAASGSLFLLDEAGNVTRHILARPNQSPEVSRRNVNMVMAEGLAGWVYRHRDGALAADVNCDERWVRLPDDNSLIGSALVVPLLYRDRVNGLLAMHHGTVGFFNESHLALAAGIAGQAAVALENARLFTQVKSEREAFLALINAMPIPVLVIDAEGWVTLANQTAQESLLVPEARFAVNSMAGGEALTQALEKLREREDKHTEVQWPDQRVFNVSINQVTQLGTVIAMDDITYLKTLDKMKTRFVETVSHDLKSPLGVILGFAQLLEMEPNLSEDGQRSLQGIRASGQNMQSLINDLLDLAKIEAGMTGHIDRYDLAQVVQSMLPGFELQLTQKQLALTLDVSPLPLPVRGNQLRLSQIAANYLSNAIKYTPAGGRIKVSLHLKNHEVWFSVTDTGYGITATAQPQLFQRFYRVPEVVHQTGESGTGLGLSIVKAIVEGYGGRVFVRSQTGQGSTFGCVLPAAE